MSIGTTGCRAVANTTAARLQWPDAAGRCNQGPHSVRVRGTSDAREAFTEFYGAGTAGTRCHGTNGATSEKGAIRLPFRGTVARVAQNATATFRLQVKIHSPVIYYDIGAIT